LFLVDAENPFKKLNSKVDLENINRLCPPFIHTYTTVTSPAALYTEKTEKGFSILSQQGVAQGDNAVRAMYSILSDHRYMN